MRTALRRHYRFSNGPRFDVIQLSHERVEHPSDFDHLGFQGFKIGFADHCSITCNEQMVFEFGRRPETYLEKADELTRGLLSATFHNVRRNRHRRPKHLAAQGNRITTADSCRCSMNVKREGVTLPPN